MDAIADNLSEHETSSIHHAPTYASWLNQTELGCRDRAQCDRRRLFTSIQLWLASWHFAVKLAFRSRVSLHYCFV